MDGMDSSFALVLIICFIAIAAIIKNVYNSSEGKGKRGEDSVETIVKKAINKDIHARMLRNIYLPKADGGTSEVDVILICTKGIFVIESKNYAGWIFGNDTQKYWTVSLYAGKNALGAKRTEKHKFYNPIWQNNSHITNLKRLLGDDIPFSSIIVFSKRSEFKSITNNSNAILLHTNELKDYILDIENLKSDILTEKQVDEIYKQLFDFRDKDGDKKRSHSTYVAEQTGRSQNINK